MRGIHIGCFAAARRAACALLVLFVLAAGDAHAKQWFVETNGLEFSPQFLTISAGDSVTFLNRGGNHNVVADDGSFRCAHGCDDDGKGGSGNATSALWIVTLDFPTAGTIGYFCEPHGAPGSGMYGSIEVLEPPPPPPPPAVDPVYVGSAGLGLALVGMMIAMAFVRLRGPRVVVGTNGRRR